MLALLLAQFLDPSKGPPQRGDFEVSPTAFILLMFAGFMIGVAGHLVKSKTMVAAGVLMIFAATVLIPLSFQFGR